MLVLHISKKRTVFLSIFFTELVIFALNLGLVFRVHEITYGFGGPIEKNVSPH